MAEIHIIQLRNMTKIFLVSASGVSILFNIMLRIIKRSHEKAP